MFFIGSQLVIVDEFVCLDFRPLTMVLNDYTRRSYLNLLARRIKEFNLCKTADMWVAESRYHSEHHLVARNNWLFRLQELLKPFI